MFGEVRKTPRWSDTATLRSCDLPKIDPSMRPIRILRPEAVSSPWTRSMMKRWPGAVSSSTSAAAIRTSRATKTGESSLSSRHFQSGRSRRGGGGVPSAVAASSAILEGLPERDCDREGPVALLTVQRDAEVDADRTEARIIADADPGRVSEVGEARQRLGGEGAAVEERHDAEIPAKGLQADARLEPEFGEAPPADRIAVDVLGAELLIAIAAHRTATARIEAPRGSDIEGRCAEDRT